VMAEFLFPRHVFSKSQNGVKLCNQPRPIEAGIKRLE
jgi:hypothetical protein